MNVFPSNNEKLITTCIFSVLIGLCLGIVISNKFTSLDFLITSLATLLAAYVGAKMAFQFQLKKQADERIRNEVTSGNKAIFELIRTYNKFITIRNQFINPQRNNPLRHYLILPVTGLDSHTTTIDYESLTFIINTKDPDMLSKLSLFEQEANSTIETIIHRSKLHYDEIQPAIEKAENKHGTQLSETQINAFIGSRHQAIIKSLTDIMVECVDSVITLAETYVSELSDLLKSEYIGHSVIKMELPKNH